MTKNNALLGGAPGGVFRGVSGHSGRRYTLRSAAWGAFFPRFTVYPRADVCRFIVYGPLFAGRFSRKLAENRPLRSPRICSVVACIAYPSVSDAVFGA